MKVPWGILVLIALVVVGGAFAAGYRFATRGQEGEIERIEERAAEERTELEAALVALADAYRDSLARATARVDTLTREVPVFRQRQLQTGETLVEHLSANDDTAGLRMFAEHVDADAQLDSIQFMQFDARLEVARLEVARFGRENLLLRARVDTLEVRLASALSEARRWRARANPPLLARVAGEVPGCAFAGTYAGLDTGNAETGLLTGGACLVGRELSRWLGRELLAAIF